MRERGGRGGIERNGVMRIKVIIRVKSMRSYRFQVFT